MRMIRGLVFILAVVVAIAYSTSGTTHAAQSFAAGAAQISVPCHMEFDARATGGHATEQCDFGNGKVLFSGPVLCFASVANMATFVWQFDISGQTVYQQVFITDNGAPGQGVPDLFVNLPESPDNPCPNIQPAGIGSPILQGNFVVRSEQ